MKIFGGQNIKFFGHLHDLPAGRRAPVTYHRGWRRTAAAAPSLWTVYDLIRPWRQTLWVSIPSNPHLSALGQFCGRPLWTQTARWGTASRCSPAANTTMATFNCQHSKTVTFKNQQRRDREDSERCFLLVKNKQKSLLTSTFWLWPTGKPIDTGSSMAPNTWEQNAM